MSSRIVTEARQQAACLGQTVRATQLGGGVCAADLAYFYVGLTADVYVEVCRSQVYLSMKSVLAYGQRERGLLYGSVWPIKGRCESLGCCLHHDRGTVLSWAEPRKVSVT